MTRFANILLIGIGATAATDLWSLLRRRWLRMPAPDWALVGRWMAGVARGRFVRARIAEVAPVRGEAAIGWTAHYLIGIAYAAVLPMLWGEAWLRHPTPGPALLVGVGTVLAPFLLMQPGMGLGVAARLAPRPWKARLHSLLMHAVFGLGLYASARLVVALQ
jgi:hypothetical protein